MRIKKKHFITLLMIMLFVLFLFLPNIINLISSEEIKYKITIAFSVLVILFLIYSTYDDIRKREFTTSLYIVLIDIIETIYFAFLFYTFLIYSGETNLDIILKEDKIRIVGLIILLCSSILQNYLKSNRFIRKK
jgi:hypothetical protein